MLVGSPLELGEDAYRSAVAEAQRLTGWNNPEAEVAARKAAEGKAMAEAAGRKAANEKALAEATARRAAEEKGIAEAAARRAAEEQSPRLRQSPRELPRKRL